MSLVAVGSVRGGPGATTLAVALAATWARPGRSPFLVEADPDGGVLAARFGLGHRPSLTELGVRGRSAICADDLWPAAQALAAPGADDPVPVVVAHSSADQCQAALRTVGPRLGALLESLPDHDVVADVGRLRPGSPAMPVVEEASLVLVVLRPRLEDIDAVAQRITALNERGAVRLVLVGERPYAAAEVASVLGVDVLGVVADDVRSAVVLRGDGPVHGIGRLPLLRSVRALAGRVAAHVDDAAAWCRWTKAVDYLGKLHAADSTQFLIQKLVTVGTKDRLRHRIVMTLGKIGDPRASLLAAPVRHAGRQPRHSRRRHLCPR